MRFTSLTIGASSSLAFSGDRSTSSEESSSPDITVIPWIASSTLPAFVISPYSWSMALFRSSVPPTTISGSSPVSRFTESIVAMSSGSSITIVTAFSDFFTASTEFVLAKSSGISRTASWSASNNKKLSALRYPICIENAVIKSSSSMASIEIKT